jgi:hypothetical protein
MRFSIKTLAELLCFLLPFGIGLSFPLQVVFNNPLAALTQLGIIILIVGVTSFRRSIRDKDANYRDSSVHWAVVVFLFLGLAIVNLLVSWIAFSDSHNVDLLPPIFLIVQASLMYLFFSRMATVREIECFYAGIVVMGFLSGLFFCLESFSKLALDRVFDYSLMAFEYTQASLGLSEGDFGQNEFRIDTNYRSFGLLERHSASAAWMIFGYFAYLHLATNTKNQSNAFYVTIVTLLFVQNFTAIITFLMLTYSFRLIQVRTSNIIIILVSLSLISIARIESADIYRESIVSIFTSQILFLIEGQSDAEITLFRILGAEAARFIDEIYERPYQLIFGYGLGTNPYYGGSGDLGLAETAMRVGLPLLIFIAWKMAGLWWSVVKSRTSYGRVDGGFGSRLPLTCSGLLLTICIMELHYSIWLYKSVFGILLFALAMAGKAADQMQTDLRRRSHVYPQAVLPVRR